MNIARVVKSESPKAFRSLALNPSCASTENQVIGKPNVYRSDPGAWFQAVAPGINLTTSANVLLNSYCDHRYPDSKLNSGELAHQ